MDPDTEIAPSGELSGDSAKVLVVVLGVTDGTHLEGCVASLSAQTHRRLTVAYVGTHDAVSRPAARPFGDARVEVESMAAVGAAANALLAKARPFDVVVFVRDDSVLGSDAIERACGVIAKTGAGVVGAKVVDADRPDVLVEVGMSADRFATAYSRLEGTELDQEQYDVTRQTLFVSFAFLAIRAELLELLGGFDPGIVGPGAELDLCWRARMAGREVLYTSLVNVGQHETDVLEDPHEHADLVRRNRLRTVLKNYSLGHTIIVGVQAVVLAFAQAIAALLASRDRGEAARYLRPWSWNMRRFGELRKLRRQAQKVRGTNDRAITRLMLGGTARLRTASDERTAETGETRGETFGRTVRSVYESLGGAWIVGFLVLVLFILVAGRALVAGPLPAADSLSPPSQSGLGLLGNYLAPFRDVELGTRAATPAGQALGGIFGFLAFGSAALAQKLLLFLGIPLAAVMCSRSLRPTIAARGPRAIAATFYVLVPLTWNAVSHGDLGVVVLAVLLPPICRRMAHLSGFGAYAEDVPPLRRKLELAALLAFATAAEPATIVAVAVVLAGWVVGSILVGGTRRCLVVAWDVLQAALGAFILLFPWSWELLGGGASQAMGGVNSPLGFAAVLRFDTGRVGGTLLVYGVLLAALLPVLVSRGDRFEWVTRWWGVTLSSFFAAWLLSRGLLPDFATPEVLLVPAALGIAVLVGWGIDAFRSDLPEMRFGLRQPAAFVLVGLGIVGLVSPLTVLPSGRLGLPPTDWRKQLTWQAAEAENSGAFVDLFMGTDVPGEPRVLQGETAFLVTGPGGPDLEDLWLPASNPGIDGLEGVVASIADAKVPYPGRLLAPFGVRYIVVPTGNDSIAEVLARALDLRLTFPDDHRNGTIYENLAWRPRVGTVAGAIPSGEPSAAELAAPGAARSVDPWAQTSRADWEGRGGGTASAAIPMDSSFHVEADGAGSIAPEAAYGWAMQFPDTPVTDQARLVLNAGPWHLLAVVLAALAWIVVLGGIIGLRGRDGTTRP